MRRLVSFGPALVVLASAVAVLLAVPAAVLRINGAETQARVTLAQQSLDGDDVLERLNRAVRNVATSVEPSVVHLDVRSAGEEVDPADPEAFSGPRSTGSGWIYSAAGHIVTNAHVVRGADEINVQFFDGRTATGKVVGVDPFTDVAVVKIPEGPGLVPARRASGSQPQQGERVFSFGSPFGFKFSMSEGIVSGLGRSARSAMEFGGFTNFIQTDAAVNPGNSGGPLVDFRGRVIGMNVAIATARNTRDPLGRTDGEGQSSGISFAIPLATIESVVEQLIAKGSVSRGFLGLTSSTAQIMHEGKFRGVGLAVREVVASGPSQAAGLKAGDVVTAIDGQSVADSDVLRAVVSVMNPGTTVTLKIWRDHDFVDLPVILGERPWDRLVEETVRPISVRLGLWIRDSGRNGPPAVRFVIPDSPAAVAGVRPDQVVTKVGGQPVKSTLEVYGAMIDQGLLLGKAVTLSLRERGAEEPETTARLSIDR